jgi:hypothetical protein
VRKVSVPPNSADPSVLVAVGFGAKPEALDVKMSFRSAPGAVICADAIKSKNSTRRASFEDASKQLLHLCELHIQKIGAPNFRTSRTFFRNAVGWDH